MYSYHLLAGNRVGWLVYCADEQCWNAADQQQLSDLVPAVTPDSNEQRWMFLHGALSNLPAEVISAARGKTRAKTTPPSSFLPFFPPLLQALINNTVSPTCTDQDSAFALHKADTLLAQYADLIRDSTNESDMPAFQQPNHTVLLPKQHGLPTHSQRRRWAALRQAGLDEICAHCPPADPQLQHELCENHVQGIFGDEVAGDADIYGSLRFGVSGSGSNRQFFCWTVDETASSKVSLAVPPPNPTTNLTHPQHPTAAALPQAGHGICPQRWPHGTQHR